MNSSCARGTPPGRPSPPSPTTRELQRLPERRLASDTGDRFLTSDRPEPAWNTKRRSRTVPTGERCSPQTGPSSRPNGPIRLGQDSTCRTGQRRRSQGDTTWRRSRVDYHSRRHGACAVQRFLLRVWFGARSTPGRVRRIPRSGDCHASIDRRNLRLGLVSISGAGRDLVRSHTVASAKSNSMRNS